MQYHKYAILIYMFCTYSFQKVPLFVEVINQPKNLMEICKTQYFSKNLL